MSSGCEDSPISRFLLGFYRFNSIPRCLYRPSSFILQLSLDYDTWQGCRQGGSSATAQRGFPRELERFEKRKEVFVDEVKADVLPRNEYKSPAFHLVFAHVFIGCEDGLLASWLQDSASSPVVKRDTSLLRECGGKAKGYGKLL